MGMLILSNWKETFSVPQREGKLRSQTDDGLMCSQRAVRIPIKTTSHGRFSLGDGDEAESILGKSVMTSEQ